MSDRIQAYLDGDLRREELTREERQTLSEYEAALLAAETEYRALREEAAANPDLSDAVLAAAGHRVDEGTRSASAGPTRPGPSFVRRLWTPGPLTLRPALAVAATAVLAFAAGLQVGGGPGTGSTAVPTDPQGAAADSTSPAHIYVHFRLDAPNASSVRLAGDFTGWEPTHELQEVAPGVWTATVPLVAGVHDYAFVVDGDRWVPDPLAAQVDDGFGGVNSRLSLLPPDEGRPAGASSSL